MPQKLNEYFNEDKTVRALLQKEKDEYVLELFVNEEYIGRRGPFLSLGSAQASAEDFVSCGY